MKSISIIVLAALALVAPAAHANEVAIQPLKLQHEKIDTDPGAAGIVVLVPILIKN